MQVKSRNLRWTAPFPQIVFETRALSRITGSSSKKDNARVIPTASSLVGGPVSTPVFSPIEFLHSTFEEKECENAKTDQKSNSLSREVQSPAKITQHHQLPTMRQCRRNLPTVDSPFIDDINTSSWPVDMVEEAPDHIVLEDCSAELEQFPPVKNRISFYPTPNRDMNDTIYLNEFQTEPPTDSFGAQLSDRSSPNGLSLPDMDMTEFSSTKASTRTYPPRQITGAALNNQAGKESTGAKIHSEESPHTPASNFLDSTFDCSSMLHGNKVPPAQSIIVLVSHMPCSCQSSITVQTPFTCYSSHACHVTSMPMEDDKRQFCRSP